jgi:hypothetical protein
MTPQVTWTIVKAEDGQNWRGVLTIPANAPLLPEVQSQKVLKLTGKKAGSKEKALANVANSALSALKNPIVQSILPPGAGLAIKAVQALANPRAIKAVARHGKKALRAIKSIF